MLLVQYEVSIDPVLDYLRETPAKLFIRDYAGYVLFLFGESDEEFATWFARRITSLDSLTGKYLAGAVFAQRVRVSSRRAERALRGKLQPWESPDSDVTNDGIDVAKIQTARLTESKWVSSEREIVAATYGSDEFAAAIGASKDMPCMVIVDGRAPDVMEIVRLESHVIENLISVFRHVVSALSDSENLGDFGTAKQASPQSRKPLMSLN